MKSLTWEQAQEAMRDGLRVRHEYFTSDEYFEMSGGQIVCEGGYNMAKWYTGEDWQKTGWTVIGVAP